MSRLIQEIMNKGLTQYDIDKLTYNLTKHCSNRGRYNVMGYITNHINCSKCVIDNIYVLCDGCDNIICTSHTDYTMVFFDLDSYIHTRNAYKNDLNFCRDCLHIYNMLSKCQNCRIYDSEDIIETCEQHANMSKVDLIDFLTKKSKQFNN